MLGTRFGNLPNEEGIFLLELILVGCCLGIALLTHGEQMHLETSVLFIFEPCRIAHTLREKSSMLPSIRKARSQNTTGS